MNNLPFVQFLSHLWRCFILEYYLSLLKKFQTSVGVY